MTTVLFVQTGFVTYPRQGEKPEVRMSEHEMIPDLEFAPKMLCVTVKRYADDVVVMRSRWCNEDASPQYGSEAWLFELFIKDFEAIRRGIETFDRDMQNKLWLKPPVNGKYIIPLEAEGRS